MGGRRYMLSSLRLGTTQARNCFVMVGSFSSWLGVVQAGRQRDVDGGELEAVAVGAGESLLGDGPAVVPRVAVLEDPRRRPPVGRGGPADGGEVGEGAAGRGGPDPLRKLR